MPFTLHMMRFDHSRTIVAVAVTWAILALSIERSQLFDLAGSSVTKKASSADLLVLQTVRLRHEIAKESFRMMMDDTEEASSSPTIDISGMIALMKEAVNTLGVRKVHEDILAIEPFNAALREAAKELGIKDFRTKTIRPKDGQPALHYNGIPNNRNFLGMQGSCHGHLWWLYHYMGSAVADLLLAGGQPVMLDAYQNAFFQSPLEYMEEMRRLQRSDYPDPGYFHSQHGFVWHYLSLMQPNIGWYPVSMLEEFCGDLVWKEEYVPDQNNDIGRECRHSFGHAIFYNLVSAEHSELNISLTNTFRPASHLTVSNSTICKWERICLGAPNQRTQNECYGGFRHSYYLYQGVKNKLEKDRLYKSIYEQMVRCRQTEEYKIWKKELWGAREMPA